LKHFSAILFSALLIWAQIMPLSAAVVTPACCNQVTAGETTACCGGDCPCCEKSSPASKPDPTVPTQARTQSPVLIATLAVVALTLPENQTISSPPVPVVLLKAADSPLYARNCVLLL
jgi:hypothetical protein